MLLPHCPQYDDHHQRDPRGCDLTPLQDVVMCRRLQDEMQVTSTTPPSPPLLPPSPSNNTLQEERSQVVHPIPLHLLAAVRYPESQILSTNHPLPDEVRNYVTKKRKSESEESDVGDEGRNVVDAERELLEGNNTYGDQEVPVSQRRQRALMARRKLAHIQGQSRKNMPLFYMYGDYLLIPNYNWFRHRGEGRGRVRAWCFIVLVIVSWAEVAMAAVVVTRSR
ncbi:hypothetical protein Pcinc_028956 [Petrolisthes cinctipes]|uniref:Uncharacterized protein n=1 Tax=Petrolisthes cinctipes TaxID=88211 RepID=A0AAE1F1Z8_PETCI|nr:hypothetical protein Pcinc_028956 [Petrolisthes cinctipes]